MHIDKINKYFVRCRFFQWAIITHHPNVVSCRQKRGLLLFAKKYIMYVSHKVSFNTVVLTCYLIIVCSKNFCISAVVFPDKKKVMADRIPQIGNIKLLTFRTNI